jgi:S-adenosylmethionine hydrolase
MNGSFLAKDVMRKGAIREAALRRRLQVLFVTLVFSALALAQTRPALVFMTDFGLGDGAVAAMKGVAYGVSPDIAMFDLTHEITPFDIWEGAFRLQQTASYWPAGTVFVTVVDPGVGTERNSVVVRTDTGHFFVTPDNGTLTLVAEDMGVDEVRIIDEETNRLEGSEESHTFFGRDVFAYTAARLAAGVISFEEVGPVLEGELVALPYQRAVYEDGAVRGSLPILDSQYGNVWSNIDKEIFDQLGVGLGEEVEVVISDGDEEVYRGVMPYVYTFGDVPEGDELLYLNSLLQLSVAINFGNFAEAHGITGGQDWSMEVRKVEE